MNDHTALVTVPDLSAQDMAAIRVTAASHGTPFFIYHAATIDQQVKSLADALPDGVELLYSVKANPNPTIIGIISRQCAGVEIASVGELEAVLAAGVELDSIAMIGPGKTAADHLAAIQYGIGMIVVESASEMARLQDAASGLGAVPVALRLNPGRISGGQLRMSGDTQFGMDYEQALTIVRERGKYPNLAIVGIHGYSGSQQTDINEIVRWTETILDMSARIQAQYEVHLNWVDLGGGFALPTRQGDKNLDIAGLKAALGPSIDSYRVTHPWTKHILFESGRFLVAPAGMLVASVLDVKVNHGRTYVVLDGGIAQFGFDDRTYGQRAPTVRPLDNRCGILEEVTLCGPLCTPSDRIAASSFMMRPNIGDFICIYNVGAYGLTGNPGLFLGQGFAPEFLIDTTGSVLIRRRFTAGDYLQATVPISADS